MKSKGFTLVELLLYVTIISGLMIGLVSFFRLVVDSRVKNKSISEVNEQGAFINDYMARTIRSSTSISTPLDGTSASTLMLATANPATNPTIFSVSSGVLKVKEGTASEVSLSSNSVQVSNLTVANTKRPNTKGLVSISFTLNRVNPSGVNEYNYSQMFSTSVGLLP